ncbi:MAG: hypothetical protein JST67_00055 [Bacteroidetes bacterium]|nr:hypothetical protein [Bacteroidota bacterium]
MDKIISIIETLLLKTVLPELSQEAIDALKQEALTKAKEWLPHAQAKAEFLKNKYENEKVLHGKIRDEIFYLADEIWVDFLTDCIKELENDTQSNG